MFCEVRWSETSAGQYSGEASGAHFKHRYYFFSCFEPCLLCFEPLSVSFASPFVCHATRHSLGRATLLACVLPSVLAASFWKVHQPFVANAQSGSLISAYANDNLATVAPSLCSLVSLCSSSSAHGQQVFTSEARCWLERRRLSTEEMSSLGSQASSKPSPSRLSELYPRARRNSSMLTKLVDRPHQAR